MTKYKKKVEILIKICSVSEPDEHIQLSIIGTYWGENLVGIFLITPNMAKTISTMKYTLLVLLLTTASALFAQEEGNQLNNQEPSIFLEVNTQKEEVPDVLTQIGETNFITTCGTVVKLPYYGVAPWVYELQTEVAQLTANKTGMSNSIEVWTNRAQKAQARAALLDSIYSTGNLSNIDLMEVVEGQKTLPLPEVEGIKIPTEIGSSYPLLLGTFSPSAGLHSIGFNLGNFRENRDFPLFQTSVTTQETPDTIVIIKKTKPNTSSKVLQIGAGVSYLAFDSRLEGDGNGITATILWSPAKTNWGIFATGGYHFLKGSNSINEMEITTAMINVSPIYIFFKGKSMELFTGPFVGIKNIVHAEHSGETYNYSRGVEFNLLTGINGGINVNISDKWAVQTSVLGGIGFGQGVFSPYVTPTSPNTNGNTNGKWKLSDEWKNKLANFYSFNLTLTKRF